MPGSGNQRVRWKRSMIDSRVGVWLHHGGVSFRYWLFVVWQNGHGPATAAPRSTTPHSGQLGSALRGSATVGFLRRR